MESDDSTYVNTTSFCANGPYSFPDTLKFSIQSRPWNKPCIPNYAVATTKRFKNQSNEWRETKVMHRKDKIPKSNSSAASCKWQNQIKLNITIYCINEEIISLAETGWGSRIAWSSRTWSQLQPPLTSVQAETTAHSYSEMPCFWCITLIKREQISINAFLRKSIRGFSH